ncbi:hypothetical protein [Methylobacter sp.]|uniref:hypothetical protein n=2 Tax=Methylobacter sp. TaxID=2051955 RepID=UPI002FE28CBB
MTALFFNFRFFIIANAQRPCPNVRGVAYRKTACFTQYPFLMSKRLLKSLVTASCLMLLLFALTAYSAEDNPHIVTQQTSQSGCTDCHINTPELKNTGILNTNNFPVDLSRFKQDGVAMCSSCHSHKHIHKNVAEKVDFPVPVDMPLSQNHEHICLTCHYSHGRLDSDQPQANVSFMDRLFDTERLHKSYLLRRDNSDGGLCLICHSSDEGPEQ